MPYLIKLKELLLDVLFPPICLNCQNRLSNEAKGSGLCEVCRSKIAVHNTLFCGTCRARLPENKKICHKSSRYLLGAAVNYDDPVKALIYRFKYHSWRRIQKPLKAILENYLKNLNLKLKGEWSVIPIPLHKNREQKRGFNQALILGEIIANYFNLPLEAQILSRAKETKSQTELKDWSQREKNLAGAFAVTNAEKLKNKSIILVDDVYTSGATVNEAVKILKEHGVGKIIAMVVAKAR